MKRRIGKYILFSCMLAMTIVCLTSTTYAFVILNQSVDVEMFNLQIDMGDGLMISLDGNNYSNGITNVEFKEQVKTNTGVNDYENLNLAPVTIRQNGGKIQYDTNGHLVMEKDGLVPVANSDVFSTHEMKLAEIYDYVTIDFYFKIVGNYDKTKNYKLVLSNEDTFIKNSNSTNDGKTSVKLENELTTYELDSTGAVNTVKYGPTETNKSIEVNPVDAMRMAFYHNVSGVNKPTSTVDLPDGSTKEYEIVIIENTLGLGSAAVEGRGNSENENYDVKWDKRYNAMYTYYNNLNPFSVYTSAAADGEAFDTTTISGPANSGNNLAKFLYVTTEEEFASIKVSATFWLEGWDADYFMGIDNDYSKFDIRLRFDLKEV